MNEIARGGYGTVFNLNINGVDYVLKKQQIEIDNPLHEMEREVSIQIYFKILEGKMDKEYLYLFSIVFLFVKKVL